MNISIENMDFSECNGIIMTLVDTLDAQILIIIMHFSAENVSFRYVVGLSRFTDTPLDGATVASRHLFPGSLIHR